jgi:hypothetical protein
MRTSIIALLSLLSTPAFAANTWYVRLDGGDDTQCDGLHDAPYGGGADTGCAFKDINYVIGFRQGQGYRDPNSLRFVGGDTLIIDDVDHKDQSRAKYMEGSDMPALVYGVCGMTDPYDCTWGAIPAGPDADHPSRIYGKQWSTGCAERPQIWGESGLYTALTVGGNNVEINCLDLLGVDPRSGNQYSAFGIFADLGIDLTNIKITNVDVHAFSNTGIMLGFGAQGGSVHDITLDGVRIYGNAMAGFGTNVTADGLITIRNSVVEWSGCTETYPTANSNIHDPANYMYCFSQGQSGGPTNSPGGYGDGIAFGPSGNQPAGDWVLENSIVRWNTQDGFDTIHGTGNGTIKVTRSWFEGNAGAAVKINAPTAEISNNVLIGDCAFFDGQTFTSTMGGPHGFMSCRAGTVVAFSSAAIESLKFYNNTVFSNQDIIIGYNSDGMTCTSSTHYMVRNNLFLGGTDWGSDVLALGDWDLTDYYYEEGCDQALFDEDYNLGFNVKHPEKFAGAHDHFLDPGIAGMFPTGPSSGPSMSDSAYYRGVAGAAQFALLPTSPALGAGTPLPEITVDINGVTRPNPPSIGALEPGSMVPSPDGGSVEPDAGSADAGSALDSGSSDVASPSDGSTTPDAGLMSGPQTAKSSCGCSSIRERLEGGILAAWLGIIVLLLVSRPKRRASPLRAAHKREAPDRRSRCIRADGSRRCRHSPSCSCTPSSRPSRSPSSPHRRRSCPLPSR